MRKIEDQGLVLTDDKRAFMESVSELREITGAAGTGKSMIMLLKAKTYLEKGESVIFITGITKMLDRYTRMLENGKLEVYIDRGLLVFERWDDFFKPVWLSVHGIGYEYKRADNKETDDNEQETGSIEDIKKLYESLEAGFQGLEKDHVMIDEAQDYSADILYCLAKLANKTFTVVGSNAQTIFDSGNRWKETLGTLESLLEKKFVSYEMNIQCRMSKEILELVKDICPDDKILEDKNLAESRGVPQVIECDNEEKELSCLVRMAKKTVGTDRRVGVIFRNSMETEYKREKNGEKNLRGIKAVREMFDAEGITYKTEANGLDEAGVWLLSVHHAKGVEFDDVILFMDFDTWMMYPNQQKLLYVAISRATSTLTMICNKNNKAGYLKGRAYKNVPPFNTDHYENYEDAQ